MTRTIRSRPIRPNTPAARRGSTIIVVVWAVAIAAIAVAGLQLVTYRHAVVGREVLGRVQARWAARAGVEETIAVLAFHTESPDRRDALRIVRDLEDVSFGELVSGTWDIRHFADGQEWAGPMDEHSKLNINLATPQFLTSLERLTPDVADAILDWRDADDDAMPLGAEWQYYANLQFGYRPRNANFRTMAELELVAGAWPQNVRGEDWNLNNRLDPNEDDGSVTWPNDRADGELNAGWSAFLTPYSVERRTGLGGEPRLNLKDADEAAMVDRFGIDTPQAAALKQWASSANAQMGTLLVTELPALASQSDPNRGSGTSGGGIARGGQGAAGASGGSGGGARGGAGGEGGDGGSRGGRAGGGGGRGGSGGIGAAGGSRGGSARGGRANQAAVKPLDLTQLRAIFDEGTLDADTKPGPGRINLNTASVELLRELLSFDIKAADAIIRLRESRPEGITSIVDLLEVPEIQPGTLQAISSLAGTSSSVYSVSSRGRSASTGVEVEIFVVVDRSSLPVRIVEYREN